MTIGSGSPSRGGGGSARGNSVGDADLSELGVGIVLTRSQVRRPVRQSKDVAFPTRLHQNARADCHREGTQRSGIMRAVKRFSPSLMSPEASIAEDRNEARPISPLS